jgi:RNA polymerase sigma-70 factor (ECF subfamily)
MASARESLSLMSDTVDELEALYRRSYATFVRVATAIVGDEQGARDAVHDGFVLAVRNRRHLRDDSAITSWVWRIVVNEARKRRHRDARFVPAAELELGSYGPAELNVDVRGVVAALPERQRLALFLRYYADLDYASIAVALRVKPGTVAAALNAAHSTLRAELEAERCAS